MPIKTIRNTSLSGEIVTDKDTTEQKIYKGTSNRKDLTFTPFINMISS